MDLVVSVIGRDLKFLQRLVRRVEMAEVVGISENYIGVKLNRIRQQLADQLKGANNEL